VGFYYEDIKLSPLQYIFTYATAMVGGAVYLSLGQLIVGRIQNPESVNSTTRLVYFVFIMSGMFGELNLLGKQVHDFVLWSPYGTVKTILAAGMKPGGWNDDALMALLVTIGYTLIFAVLGIKWFKWNTK
jgi:ABC-2 type transport system permease protein